jgi:multiple antibiotic resistance protein
MMKDFLLTFVPIFVAVDAIGVLPMFIALTEGIKAKDKKRIILQSVVTAWILAFCFILLGKWVFNLLGITINDFMIAGGALLFIISVRDIMNPARKKGESTKDLGAVPLGTPLIVGPAVLTTCLILIETHGISPTLISITINVILAGVIFSFSHILIKILGEAGARALSKIMSLLLAAIAVMMIRKGVIGIIELFK